MPEFSNKTHYNAEEAARELDRSAPEIENLILSGRLQTEIVDGKRIIPAQALDDFHARISSPDIKARVMLEEGNNDRLVEPDQIASPPGNSDAGESHNVDPEGAYYYSPSQAAELLSTDLYKVNKLVNRGELPPVSINKHRWLPAKAVEDLARQRYGPGKLNHAPQPVSKEEAERIISRREPQRQVRIRRRLPQPHKISEQPPTKTSPDVISNMELVDAAQRFGTSTNEIRQMIATGKLVRHPSSGNLVKSANDSSGATNAPETEETLPPTPPDGDSYYSVREAAEKLDKSSDDVWEMVYRGKLPVSTVRGERVFSKLVIDDLTLENHPGPVQGTSSRSSERKGNELQTSQHSEAEATEGYYYTPGQAARLLGKDAYEINLMIHRKWLPVVWVNGKRWIPEQSVEARMSKSDQRKWNQDSGRPEAHQIRKPESQTEQEAGKDVAEAEDYSNSAELKTPIPRSETESKEEIEMLHDKLRGERELNQRLTGELEQERADHVRDVQDVRYEIDQEKNRQRKNEELFGDLQAKLERNEARNRELENALSSEMAKTLRLEEEKRILDEIRRVLGAEPSQPSERTEAATPVDTQREEPENTNNELLINTRYGRWIFRPPFALEEDEIELLKLVAGEDEITAEQIRRKTDRRRATDDLDDLLDRLADEGLEPIKEINDRYSFDPNFLQD